MFYIFLEILTALVAPRSARLRRQWDMRFAGLAKASGLPRAPKDVAKQGARIQNGEYSKTPPQNPKSPPNPKSPQNPNSPQSPKSPQNPKSPVGVKIMVPFWGPVPKSPYYNTADLNFDNYPYITSPQFKGAIP